MPVIRRLRLPSPSTLIALTALVVASTGTAVAATGTLVNIADPSNASRVAKVTSQGQLTTENASPRGFFSQRYVLNGYKNSTYAVFLGPTKSTVALSHLTLTTPYTNSETWYVYLYQVGGATAAECAAGGNGTFITTIQEYKVGSVESFDQDFADPIVLKPRTAGAPWCLVSASYPASSATPNLGLPGMVSGHVIDGAPIPSTAKTGSAPAPGKAPTAR